MVLFSLLFSYCGFGPDVLLFFRVLGLGFFFLLFSFGECDHAFELCVFLALFLLVFMFFFAKFGSCKCVFLHGC